MNTQVLVIKLPMPIEGMTHMEIRAYPRPSQNAMTDVWVGLGKPTRTKRFGGSKRKQRELRLVYSVPADEEEREMLKGYDHLRLLAQPCPFHDGTGWKMPELQVFIQQAITDLLEYAEAKRDEA